jgi:hypothetical protein
VTQKQMPSQREQYGSTVQLFIDTGRSPCKITLMPFTFDDNLIVVYQGLNSLFIFKSVPLFAVTPARTFGSVSTFVLFWSTTMLTFSPRIPVHTLYSRNTVKSCF